MRKNVLFLGCILLLSHLATAQVLMPTVGYIGGILQSRSLGLGETRPALMINGFSAGLELGLNSFYQSATLDRMRSSYTEPLSAGKERHTLIRQNLFKYLAGFGGFIVKERLMLLVQGGFTLGKDYVNRYREYSDGSISYGQDAPEAGVFEGFRALPPILAVKLGYKPAGGLMLMLNVERAWGKGFGSFEFHDWHTIKNGNLATGSGSGKSPFEYLGADDLRAWKFELSLRYLIKLKD